MDQTRVIHLPLEIAGQVGLICEFLRKEGWHATGYNYYTTYLKYRNIHYLDANELLKIMEPAIRFYDLFHFHNSYTFMLNHADLPLIDGAGKKMIMHHRGNDVRAEAWARRGDGYENPYVNADGSLSEEEIDRNLRYFATYMSAAIVQDYELYFYVKDYYEAAGKPVYLLPRLVNTGAITPAFPEHKTLEPPLIVHAPTNQEFKGTPVIEAVIEQLRKEIPLRYVRVEKMTKDAASQLYREADIVIDQILCGMYGNVSVEAMALGKPVVAYLRPDLLKLLPAEIPIISAHPDNLYEQLRALLLDADRRVMLGRRGRAFVEEHHEAGKVVASLLQIYQNVLHPKS